MVIEQPYGGPKITKDGVTVAKNIEFKCKFQNLGASLVKQVANATNDVAGDGAPQSTPIVAAARCATCAHRQLLDGHTHSTRRFFSVSCVPHATHRPAHRHHDRHRVD